jgi:hypothetical protein
LMLVCSFFDKKYYSALNIYSEMPFWSALNFGVGYTGGSTSGWPDWAKGWWLSLGTFLKITQVAHILGLLFSSLRLYINFDKNELANFFHKLIWSPCSNSDYKSRRLLCCWAKLENCKFII